MSGLPGPVLVRAALDPCLRKLPNALQTAQVALQFQGPAACSRLVSTLRAEGDRESFPCLTFWKCRGVQGLRSLLFQPQPWSCGASVCFLDNRERKPPFRRPGRPQQPHTHTQRHRDSQAAAHTQAPASARAGSTARLRAGRREEPPSPSPSRPAGPSPSARGQPVRLAPPTPSVPRPPPRPLAWWAGPALGPGGGRGSCRCGAPLWP